MRYIAAYLLATLGGNQSPSAADVAKILSSSGAQVEQSEVEKIVAEFSGKDLNSLISQGSSKLASIPAGGAVSSAAAPAAAAGVKAAAKEEKKVVEEEEEGDMGFGLFD